MSEYFFSVVRKKERLLDIHVFSTSNRPISPFLFWSPPPLWDCKVSVDVGVRVRGRVSLPPLLQEPLFPTLVDDNYRLRVRCLRLSCFTSSLFQRRSYTSHYSYYRFSKRIRERPLGDLPSSSGRGLYRLVSDRQVNVVSTVGPWGATIFRHSKVFPVDE